MNELWDWSKELVGFTVISLLGLTMLCAIVLGIVWLVDQAIPEKPKLQPGQCVYIQPDGVLGAVRGEFVKIENYAHWVMIDGEMVAFRFGDASISGC